MAAAEVNGSSAPAKEEEEPMDVTTPHTENYQTLIDAGLPQKVAESLDNIFQTGGWWLFLALSLTSQGTNGGPVSVNMLHVLLLQAWWRTWT